MSIYGACRYTVKVDIQIRPGGMHSFVILLSRNIWPNCVFLVRCYVLVHGCITKSLGFNDFPTLTGSFCYSHRTSNSKSLDVMTVDIVYR